MAETGRTMRRLRATGTGWDQSQWSEGSPLESAKVEIVRNNQSPYFRLKTFDSIHENMIA